MFQIMSRYRLIMFAGIGIVVSLWATAAYADSIAPLLIPGFLTSSVNWIAAIPTIIFITILEVPFFAAAGVRERLWRRTFFANLISMAVGIVFPAYAHHVDFNRLVLAAIILSVVVEVVYLAYATRKSLNWTWVVIGNVTTSVILMSLSSFWVVAIDRVADPLRDLGAEVHYSWYMKTHRVSCVNPGLVTDARLEQWVPHLKNLHARYLDLSGSQVTDEGLIHLADVSTLTYVDLRDASVTQEGVDTLQKALPRVVVYPETRNRSPGSRTTDKTDGDLDSKQPKGRSVPDRPDD